MLMWKRPDSTLPLTSNTRSLVSDVGGVCSGSQSNSHCDAAITQTQHTVEKSELNRINNARSACWAAAVTASTTPTTPEKTAVQVMVRRPVSAALAVALCMSQHRPAKVKQEGCTCKLHCMAGNSPYKKPNGPHADAPSCHYSKTRRSKGISKIRYL
jgi:hypothetical protein